MRNPRLGTIVLILALGAGPFRAQDARNADTAAPEVTDVVCPSGQTVTAGTYPVEVRFSEPMDTDAGCYVTFGTEKPYTGNQVRGTWIDERAWKGTLTVDAKTVNGTQTIKITGARDKAQNPMATVTGHGFTVDTRAPGVTEVATDPSGSAGAGKLTVTVSFDEKADTRIAPAVSCGVTKPFRDIRFTGAWQGAKTWQGSAEVAPGLINGTHTFRIAGVKDARGNEAAAYTSFRITIDTQKPVPVVALSSGTAPVAPGRLEVTLLFDEDMDTGTDPAVSFGPAAPYDAVTVKGAWKNRRQWSGTVAVDGKTPNGTMTLAVRNARDAAGNVMDAAAERQFDVDSHAPELTAVTADPLLSGAGAVTVTVVTGEPVNTDTAPDVRCTPAGGGTALPVRGTWRSPTQWQGTVTVAEGVADGVYALAVAGVADAAGNTTAPYKGDGFRVDTRAPGVKGAELSRTGAVGPGDIGITVTFDEDVDRGRAPSVACGPVVFEGAFTSAREWKGSARIAAGMPGGTFAAEVTGYRDPAGNAGTPFSGTTITVDTEAPAVTLAALDRSGRLNAGPVTVTVTFSEPLDPSAPPQVNARPDNSATLYPYTGSFESAAVWKGVLEIVPDMPQGAYTTTVTGGRDAAGNACGAHTMAPFTVDTRAPGIAAADFRPGRTAGTGDLTVTVRFTEEMDVKKAPVPAVEPAAGTFSGEWIRMDTWEATMAVTDGMTPGTRTLTVSEARDEAGNGITPAVAGTFVIDNVPPALAGITYDRPAPVGAGELTLSITVSEPVDADVMPTVVLQPSAEGAPLACTGGWTDSVTWRGSCRLTSAYGAGTYTPVVSGASDRVGNRMGTVRGAPVELDPVPPVVAGVKLPAEGAVGAGTLAVTVTYDEPMDTSAAPAVTFGRGAFAGRWSGARTWRGRALITRETPQGITVVSVAGGRDRAGNIQEQGEHGSFIVDTRPPDASGAMVIAADGEAYTTERDIRVSWSGFDDAGSGIVTYYYADTDGGGTRNGTAAAGDTAVLTAAADGPFEVFVWAEDAAGNTGAAARDRVMIDTEPPAVTGVTADRKLTGTGRVRITVVYDEPMDRSTAPLVVYGPAGTEPGTAAGRWQDDTLYTADIPVGSATPNGVHRVRVTGGSDRAGNTAGRDSSCSFVVDTEPPRVVETLFDREGPFGPGPLALTVVFNESVDTAVSPAVDISRSNEKLAVAGSWADEKTWKGTAELKGLADGTYRIRIAGTRDRAGNVMEPAAAASFVFDATPPVAVSFTVPVTGPMDGGSLPCTLAFSEPMDTTQPPQVTAAAPGASLPFKGAWNTERRWCGSLNTGDGMADGAYRMTAAGARDRAGNGMAELAGTTFVVDTRPPEITDAAVAVKGGASLLNTRTFTVAMSGFRDAGTGISRYYYAFADNGGTGNGTASPAPEGTLTADGDGMVRFFAWAADNAGNISPAVAGSVIIDATPPVLSAVEFGRPDAILRGAVPVTLRFNEDMDRSAAPKTVFGAEGAVTPAAHPWTDARTWHGRMVIDAASPSAAAFLAVSGVSDRAGNSMAEDRATAYTVPAAAFFQYAEALLSAGDTAAAEAQFRKCVTVRGTHAAAYRRLGDIRSASNDAEGASGYYRKAAAADPLDAGLQFAAGTAAAAVGRHDEAAALYRRGRALEDGVPSGTDAATLPVAWITVPLIPAGRTAYSAYALYRLQGEVLAARNDWSGAADAFAKCLELDEQSAAVRYNLGTALLLSGKPERGMRELEQAAGMDSSLRTAELHLGVAAAMQGSLAVARKRFAAVTGGNTGAAARANLALLDALQGDRAGAAAALDKAGRTGSPAVLAYNRALLAHRLGRYDAALSLLQNIQRFPGGAARIAALHGAVLQDLERNDEAVPLLLAALARDPFLADACYRMGRAMQERDAVEAAEIWYTRAVRLRPGFREAYANLGLVYGRLGMRDKEMAAYARAHELKKEETAGGRAVAITAFGNTSGNAEYAWLGTGIAEALSSDLRSLSGLRLVERLKVENAMREMALASTDLIAGTTGDIKKLTGAEIVLTGGYQVVGDDIKIDARMIDAATGEVLAAADASGRLDDIFDVERNLALNLLQETGAGPDDGERQALRKRQKGSLDALRYLSEGMASYYRGDDGAMDEVRRAVRMNSGFADVLGDIDPLTADQKRQRTIAVMAFGNTTGNARHDGMKKGIAEALTTDLKNVTGLYLVERVALKSALDEINLGMADVVDAKTAPKIGNMVGAGVILTGSFQVQDATLRIDCRMVDAGSGDVLFGESVQGTVDGIFDLEEELALKIADAVGVGVSEAERMQMAASDPARAALRGIALEQSGLAEDIPAEEQNRAMALVPFRNNSGSAARRYAWLQESITEVLTTEFRKSGRVRLVDRSVVAARIGEESLQDLVGMEEMAPEARKLIPADFLLQGGYQVVGDNLRIDGRLVEVETGSILFTESAAGPKSDVLAAELDLAAKILESIGRSARGKRLDTGRELAGDARLKAPTWWVTGGAGAAAAAFITSQALYSGARSDYDRTGEGYNTANGYYQARNFFLGSFLTAATAAGTSYLWNRYWRTAFLQKKKLPRGSDVAGTE